MTIPQDVNPYLYKELTKRALKKVNDYCESLIRSGYKKMPLKSITHVKEELERRSHGTGDSN